MNKGNVCQLKMLWLSNAPCLYQKEKYKEEYAEDGLDNDAWAWRFNNMCTELKKFLLNAV